MSVTFGVNMHLHFEKMTYCRGATYARMYELTPNKHKTDVLIERRNKGIDDILLKCFCKS